ncbi:hypothetical protein [Desulfohalovibrio reitneri]|jgi:hypothetical protein|uniref:hypothetical protein n=1 Tax=Desulfohalovibrio reitneri TaxID=1307759 RepID=UPI0004A70E9B|nr:hypothetical protein [Desulfohalovibrio reitneri]
MNNPLIDIDYLERLEEYLASGQFSKEFENATEANKHGMLEFLEKLMDVAELADETATKVIYKGSFLEQMAGVKDHTER